MTEKQKAEAGLLYNANHPVLLKERASAKKKLFAFNSTPPDCLTEREQILRDLLGACGSGILIEPPFYCDYGYNISVGDNFYANVGCTLLDGAAITIGNNVFLGPSVGLYTAGHPLDAKTRNEGLEYAYKITLGHNVWIGAGAIVLPGVHIGQNSVIGAGSVVTKDVPEGVLAAGNPCRIIRYL